MIKNALVLGATGAVGKQVLKDVLSNGKYANVVSLGRRKVDLDESIPQNNLVQKIIDFENLEANRTDFRNVSDVYCCLGTTRSGTESAEQFVKIDQTYVVNSAKIIAEENKKDESTLLPVHFLYCSSLGANANSWFVYVRSKGETENALGEVGFQKLSIFHPTFLVVAEPRLKTSLSEKIAAYVVKPFDKLGFNASIHVATVAKSMHKVAESESVEADKSFTSKVGSLVSYFGPGSMKKIVD